MHLRRHPRVVGGSRDPLQGLPQVLAWRVRGSLRDLPSALQDTDDRESSRRPRALRRAGRLTAAAKRPPAPRRRAGSSQGLGSTGGATGGQAIRIEYVPCGHRPGGVLHGLASGCTLDDECSVMVAGEAPTPRTPLVVRWLRRRSRVVRAAAGRHRTSERSWVLLRTVRTASPTRARALWARVCVYGERSPGPPPRCPVARKRPCAAGR